MKWLWILGFGVLGVFLRYILSVYIQMRWPSFLPVPTFLINVLGCFVMGIVYAFGVEKGQVSDELRMGVMVGLLGGFTTFSSYSLEVVQLIQASLFLHAGMYVVLSQIFGLGATALGIYLTRLIF